MGLSLAPLGPEQTRSAVITLLSHDCTLTSVQIIICILALKRLLFETLVSLDISLALSQGPIGHQCQTCIQNAY